MLFDSSRVQRWTTPPDVGGRDYPDDGCLALRALNQIGAADFSQQLKTAGAVFAMLVTTCLVFINGHSFHSPAKPVKLPQHHIRSRALGAKTIIVTGAAGALGSALSMVVAREGFNTVMVDCDQRGLEQAYDRITKADLPDPALYPLDLSAAGPENFDEMLDKVSTEFGGLDAVVHCAARFEGLTPLEQISPTDWLLQIQVNLNAAWLLSAQCLPLLRNSKSGHLYFMLENLPKVRGAFWGAYCVSKHALRALVNQFAAECKSSRIQVLGINPGPFRSGLRARAYHAENPASQPSPQLAAEHIMELLKGDIEPDDNFVNLQRD